MKLLPTASRQNAFLRRSFCVSRHLDAGVGVQKSVARKRLAEGAERLEHRNPLATTLRLAAGRQLELPARGQDRPCRQAVEQHVLIRSADVPDARLP